MKSNSNKIIQLSMTDIAVIQLCNIKPNDFIKERERRIKENTKK